MSKLMIVVACMVIIFFPKEALVSQVVIEKVDPIPLAEIIRDRIDENTHVLVVKGPVKSELFKEVKFPTETHYQKKEESVYQEFVFQYQIQEVIRSDHFKSKSDFWVWEQPAYGLEAIRHYHTEGMLFSPIVLEPQPNYSIKDDHMIVFVSITEQKSKPYPQTYHVEHKEGLGALSEIKKILNLDQKKWWELWK